MQLIVIKKANILGMELNVYGDVDNPLFLARDIAERIEHNQVTRMMELVDDEDEKLMCQLSTSGQSREMWFLTEDGVYSILMKSRTEIAKEFRKGFKEFLKAWRKGQVKVVEAPQVTMTIEDIMIRTLQEQKEIRSRVDVIEHKIDNEIRLDSGEQRKLQKAISVRVFQRLDVINAEKKLLFPALHRDVRDRFGVASYKDVKRKDFKTVLEYVHSWVEKTELRDN